MIALTSTSLRPTFILFSTFSTITCCAWPRGFSFSNPELLATKIWLAGTTCTACECTRTFSLHRIPTLHTGHLSLCSSGRELQHPDPTRCWHGWRTCSCFLMHPSDPIIQGLSHTPQVNWLYGLLRSSRMLIETCPEGNLITILIWKDKLEGMTEVLASLSIFAAVVMTMFFWKEDFWRSLGDWGRWLFGDELSYGVKSWVSSLGERLMPGVLRYKKSECVNSQRSDRCHASPFWNSRTLKISDDTALLCAASKWKASEFTVVAMPQRRLWLGWGELLGGSVLLYGVIF